MQIGEKVLLLVQNNSHLTMHVPVIVSSWVAIHVEYVVEIVSFYFTVYWFLVAEEKVSVDAYGDGNAGLFGELGQIV